MILNNLIVVVVGGLMLTSASAELLTLFTTRAERQMIDKNRYLPQRDDKSPRKTVTQSFSINGITLSNAGQHRVWINEVMYQDGEQIEGRYPIKIIIGDKIRIRITTSGNRHYFGTSGETIKISYTE